MRLRNGREVDRLHLTPLYEDWGGDEAGVQRWRADYDKDFEASKLADFPALVSKRSIVQIMHFADFDHDGKATEFYLQTGAGPCGHMSGVVVGLSRSNAKLHVFGTASEPEAPLYLEGGIWEELLKATRTIDVLDSGCGDHGAETEIRLRLHWNREGIDGVRREYTCPPNPRRLIGEKPLSVD